MKSLGSWGRRKCKCKWCWFLTNFVMIPLRQDSCSSQGNLLLIVLWVHMWTEKTYFTYKKTHTLYICVTLFLLMKDYLGTFVKPRWSETRVCICLCVFECFPFFYPDAVCFHHVLEVTSWHRAPVSSVLLTLGASPLPHLSNPDTVPPEDSRLGFALSASPPLGSLSLWYVSAWSRKQRRATLFENNNTLGFISPDFRIRPFIKQHQKRI